MSFYWQIFPHFMNPILDISHTLIHKLYQGVIKSAQRIIFLLQKKALKKSHMNRKSKKEVFLRVL